MGRIWLFFLAVACVLYISRGEGVGLERKANKGGGKKTRVNPQKIALEKWANTLQPRDYNYSEWRIMFHSRSTVDFFNGYARKLSDLFKDNNAKVNFAMIGTLPRHLYIECIVHIH